MSELLIVDDEPSIREYLEVLFSKHGHQVRTAANLREAKEALEVRTPDLVVTDFRLGRESGLDVLRAARAMQSPPEVIVVTAFGTTASAVEAMRQGAYDYVTKPFDNDELVLLVERALEKRTLLAENRQLRSSALGASVFLGASPAMQQVWAVVQKVAPTRATVLITGESGSGKEVVARAIHLLSPRAGRPFVPVNCGALAEGVLESELFGHVKGAFTGATTDRPGLLVAAGEGTVMLDEVGELPLGTQVKLLRVLQERTVKPVGSSREVPFEARIVAATNRNLEAEVRAGRFREDLLFRLNVISVEVPPLRQRREDVPRLAEFFLERIARDLGRPKLRLSAEAIEVLQRFAFPGNVRQMQNVIERAATLSDSDELGLSSLPPLIQGTTAPVEAEPDLSLPPGFSLERHLDGIERRYLHEALRRESGSKTRAAQALGLSFRSFRYRLAKHGLPPDDA
ncbi:MAG: sigma-54-dependent Fis family transcriptional regulator [Myxococcaceae bacterium]|jgi:two-component system response regulator PilR (NtrC family)|nr:sigma-54-dependent Fis family transcriptional regulator [Myxococcaceae bacterium]MCA3015606.1 sigma-54-dependent Fis family transcriptional regulator [Myxococcaceae bacterium]